MKNRNLWNQVLILIALVIFSSSAMAQSLTASFDRNAITTNETVNLSLTLNGSISTKSEPNWAPLSKSFKLLANSSRTMMNIINGKSSMQTVWTAVLMPLHAGEINIPPLHVGKLQSNALKLTVTKAAAGSSTHSSGKKAADIFLEASVNTNQPYVQQQVVYTVKVFSREQMSNAFLTPPAVGNTPLQSMGQELNYQVERNGKRYKVVEIRYLLLPQSAGKYDISPAVFNAVVPMPGQSNLFNNSFFSVSGRTQRLVAPEISINVRKKPAAFSGQWWLPAKAVVIKSSWAPNPPKFEVGTPITRTLTIQAVGLSGNQLPDLPMPQITNANVYPDQPTSNTEIRNGELVGLHQVKIAIVPTKAGPLQLPEIKVNWWDTKTDKQASAILPAQTINVLPAPAGNPVTAAPATPTQKTLPEPKPQTVVKSVNYWPWIIAALFFCLWLATVFLWWYKRPVKQKQSFEKKWQLPIKQRSQRDIRAVLEKACRTNDAMAAKNALIDWAREEWVNESIINLTDVAKQINTPQFNLAIKALNAVFYAKQDVNWDGEEFWQRFCDFEAHAGSQQVVKEKQDLPPLHLN